MVPQLSEYDIVYYPRLAIKAQAITNFLAEFSYEEVTAEVPKKHWDAYMEESSNFYGSGAGLIIVSPRRVNLQYALQFDFRTKYEAVIATLRIYKALRARKVVIRSDSQLIVNEIGLEY